MKKPLISLLLAPGLFILFLLGNLSSKASHFIGSDIIYTCTATPNVYDVTVKIYKDCAGVLLCPCPGVTPCSMPLSIVGASGSCNGVSFGSQSLTVVPSVSGLDVMQLCVPSPSICTNCGTRTAGSYTPGVEIYVFSGQINLQSLPASCCMVSIGFGNCCRNSAITTLTNPGGLSFYVEAVINRCASPCNSSPVFNLPSEFAVIAGTDVFVNIGASDPDNDSLSYSWGTSLTGPGVPAPYQSPYSATVPFSYLGAPLQSPPAMPPVGISLNSVTGDGRFRPFGYFVSNLVVEVRQWKNIAGVPTLMGYTRRDHQFYSQTGSYTALASVKKYDTLGTYLGIAPSTEYGLICAGQRICRNYAAGSTHPSDTTDLSWSAPVNMPGATFTPLYNPANRVTNGPRLDSFRFCWTAPTTAASNTPYVAVILARSRGCNIKHKSTSTFAIYVSATGAPGAMINKTPVSTNTYKFTYIRSNMSIPDKALTQWQVETAPGSNTYTTTSNDTIAPVLFTQNGKYRVKLFLTSACGSSSIITDSITATSLSISVGTLKHAGCKGDSTGKIIITATNGRGPVQYKLNNGSYQASNTFSNLVAGNYFVRAKDSLNYADSMNITVTQPDSVMGIDILSQSPVKCKGDSTGGVVLLVKFGKSPYQYKMGTGSFQASGTFSGLPAGIRIFSAKDSNNCAASININFTQPDSSVRLIVSSLQNLRCKGDSSGMISLAVANGSAPYQFKMNNGAYQASNSFTNAVAGTQLFSVIDSNSCKATVQATFTEPVIGVVLSASNIKHVGCRLDSTGSVTVVASSGIAPYQYKLSGSAYQSSNVFNNLFAGTKTFMVLDSVNCPASLTLSITQPATGINLQTSAVTNVGCNGDSSASVSLVTGSPGKAPFLYKINGGNYQSGNSFGGLKAGTSTFYVIDSNNCKASKDVVITEPTKLNISLTYVPPQCHNGFGTITVSGVGGTPSYTFRRDSLAYSPSSSFSGLLPATYAFSVKDVKNCIASASGTLINPAALAVTPELHNVTCFGLSTGSIKLITTGGYAPYKFKLGNGAYVSSNNFGNLTSGTYSFAIKDSANCTTSAIVGLTQPAVIVTSMTSTQATCAGLNNGTASITAIGGTKPYTYSWITSPVQVAATAVNLPTGYAKVILSDSNACSKKDSVMVTARPQFNGEQICEVTNDTNTGANIIVWNATPGVGIAAYKIYVSNSDTGPFVLASVQNATFVSASPDSINVTPSQAYYYYLKSVDSCANESSSSPVHKSMFLEATHAGGGMYELNWNIYNGAVVGGGLAVRRSANGGSFDVIATLPLSATSYIDSVPPPGPVRYITDLTLSKSCALVLDHIYSNTVVMNPSSVIENISISKYIDVYPNPTTGLLRVRITKPATEISAIEIYNVLGSKVKEQVASGTESNIDMSMLANGIYHVAVIAGNERYAVKVVLSR